MLEIVWSGLSSYSVFSSLSLTVQFRSWLSELETNQKSTEDDKSETDCKPRLAMAILKTFGWSYVSLGFFTFLEECVIRVYQPIFMGNSAALFVVNISSYDDISLGWMISYFTVG